MIGFGLRKLHKSLFLRDKFILLSAIFNLLAILGLSVLLYWRIKPLSQYNNYGISLHYNVYFGVDLIGAWYQVFILPLLGLFIFLINYILSFWLYLKDKALSYILVNASSVSIIFLFIAGIFIILINL